MESARSFRTASYSFRRFEEKDFTGVLSGDAFKGEGNALGEEDKGNSKEKKNAIGDNMITKEEILDLQKKMEGVNKNRVYRSEEETDKETIRQNSIMYILELLFKDARARFHDWIEKNSEGISVNGNSSGNGYFKEFAPANTGTLSAADLLTTDVSRIMQTPVKRISYQSVDRYEEAEDTTFSAKGIVRTADGREIDFNIDVSMSRRFMRETAHSLDISAVQTCDPLVINLDGGVSTVTDQKIRFDIDGDGELDTINQLAAGSGFIALDKNGDGTINDGNELFGSKSGDGFADLEEYDTDGNGWIDEDDGIWDKLKIWAADEKGRMQLYSLAEAGVGALCLNRRSTEFSDTDDSNRAKAFIRSTGVFLYENGMAGTMQHLDLVKYMQEA